MRTQLLCSYPAQYCISELRDPILGQLSGSDERIPTGILTYFHTKQCTQIGYIQLLCVGIEIPNRTPNENKAPRGPSPTRPQPHSDSITPPSPPAPLPYQQPTFPPSETSQINLVI